MPSLPRHGFTLIELLVVISIIALLIALLMPTLSSARDAGMTTQNITQARQISISLMSYAVDHKQSLPFQRYNSPIMMGSAYWAGMITHLGYTADPFVFWGPFRRTDWFGTSPWTSRQDMAASPLYAHSYERTGFGANNYLMPMRYTGHVMNRPHRVNQPVPTSKLNPPASNHPSVVPLLAEFYYGVFEGSTDAATYGKWVGPNGGGLFCPNGAATRAYLDGHAIAGEPSPLGWQNNSDTSGMWMPNTIVNSRWHWFNPN